MHGSHSSNAWGHAHYKYYFAQLIDNANVFIQNEEFWRACESGDLAAVRKAIRGGNIDIDWRRAEGHYHVCL